MVYTFYNMQLLGGDYYYAGGATTGVDSRYSISVYLSSLSGYCKTGVDVNPGDWGASVPLCSF